jgi:hypothetical protein
VLFPSTSLHAVDNDGENGKLASAKLMLSTTTTTMATTKPARREPEECGDVQFGWDILDGLFVHAHCSGHGDIVLSDDECKVACSTCSSCTAFVTDSTISSEGMSCWMTSGPVKWTPRIERSGGLPCRNREKTRVASDADSFFVEADILPPHSTELPAWRFSRCAFYTKEERATLDGLGDCSLQQVSEPISQANDGRKARVAWLESMGRHRFGVNTHFTEPATGEMDDLSEAFKTVRIDVFWFRVEVQKGVYNWTAYDDLLVHLTAHGVQPMFILDYGNENYANCTEHPRSDECREAFTNYAMETVMHFRGRRILWELYNEPNGFWANWGEFREESKVQYADLLNRFGKALRDNLTIADEILVGPATSGIDLDWIENVSSTGALQYLDGISVHPYRAEGPETVSEEYEKLRELIRGLVPVGQVEPAILSGEWGWPSCGGQEPAVCPDEGGGVGEVVSLHEQASRLARQWLINDKHRIALSIWYDWKNDGDDPMVAESNFGNVMNSSSDESRLITGHPFKRKLNYFAARTLQQLMAPRRFAGAVSQGSPTEGVWVLRYDGVDGDSKGIAFAIWSIAMNGQVVALPIELTACLAIVSFLGGYEGTLCPGEEDKFQVWLDPHYLVPCTESPIGSCVEGDRRFVRVG